ncbi:hypothetical protein [Methylobacter sp.]|uniref:hypothetical protein n=1 Tax=Methylobacter sp. TaxID=2051955 RepID=UPI002FDECC8B
MSKFAPQQERLLFLAKVARREIKHLQSTDNRLFAQPLTLVLVAQLDSDEDLAERVEAFISRFGRLQDTLGDKLLPNLLGFVGERTATAVDNLDRAERLGWIKSSDGWNPESSEIKWCSNISKLRKCLLTRSIWGIRA